jgi:sec-independent protein translocase protein TatB
MFGLGWGEMVVIGIVALIAIGPKELPTVLRTIGQWMGKVRRMANEFQGQFQEALREVELSDLKKHADDIAADVSNFDPMKDTRQEMEKAFAFDDPLKDINTSLDTPPAPLALADASPAPPPGGLTDGEKLPAAAIPSTDLPPVDVPMPELPAPVTEKDFAPAAPQPQTAQTETPAKSGTGT